MARLSAYRADNARRFEAKPKGRRGARGSRPGERRSGMGRVQLTVGDLIAAAHDALGDEVRAVARLLSSPELAAAVHRRIVLV